MNNTINFNDIECIKEYDKLGSTQYVDICNNTQYNVPWGISGWLILVFNLVIIIFIISGIIALIKLVSSITKDEDND